MEDQDTIPPEYLTGFNKGYTIAEHMPELAAKLAKAKGNSLQLDGIRQGIEQYDLEKTKELNKLKDHYPGLLGKDNITSTEKDTDSREDKDRDDPDRE